MADVVHVGAFALALYFRSWVPLYHFPVDCLLQVVSLLQVVLIGDHKQLQPIILCRQASDCGLGVSMFERLHGHAGMLTIQYRMVR